MFNSRKVILYIAMSLDGYIAGKDDDLSFLSLVEKEGEDYGYSEFISSIDTVIMGRKTFDKVLSFGIPFPHSALKTYIITRTSRPPNELIEFYNGDLSALIAGLKQSSGKHIFVDGGAEIAAELMKNNLIDELVISIIPTLLGDGVLLFKKFIPRSILKLQSVKTFPSGLVQLCYSMNAEEKLP